MLAPYGTVGVLTVVSRLTVSISSVVRSNVKEKLLSIYTYE
jgi:hypothetical protein